jgi:hypothetical protein
MRIDFYTKAVLTIIAGALVWIAAGAADVLPVVDAQDRTPTRVIVVGWESGGAGGSRTLPLPIEVAGWTDRRGERFQLPTPTPVELARERGVGLPGWSER